MLESRESSSPILTRSINGVFSKKEAENYKFSSLERIALWMMGFFPQSLSLKIIPRFQAKSAISKSHAESIQIDELLQERLSDYSSIVKKHNTILLGVGLGGATGHIATALSAPFLPHSFVLTIQGGSKTADIDEYFEQGWGVTQTILKNNTEVSAIQHFDPIHDGWLTRSVNHIRLKLLGLPSQYQDFIEKNLNPRGNIIYLEGDVPWSQFLTSPRSVFQVGGWGGIPDDEYLYGSAKIEKFKKQYMLTKKPWNFSRFETIKGIESEWGSPPSFKASLKKYCDEKGFQLHVLPFSHPFIISKIAYHAMKTLFRINNVDYTGTIIEMFSQYDLYSTLQAKLLPIWLIFNTEDSLRNFQGMLDEIDNLKPVYFSGLSTFTLTPDMVPYTQWENAMNNLPFINIGARYSHFPADTWALLFWKKNIKKLGYQNHFFPEKYIDAKELMRITRQINSHSKC